MHPLIFLKEHLHAYVKGQNNWIFQFLKEKEKQDYLQVRRPRYKSPYLGAGNSVYSAYMKEIKAYHEEHPNEEILSIQTFACNGVVMRGR